MRKCLFQEESSEQGGMEQAKKGGIEPPNPSSEEVKTTYNMVLKSELFGQADDPSSPSKQNSNSNMFKYKTSKSEKMDSPFSLTPMSDETQKLLSSPRKPLRKISKTPFKVLEAPSIEDDYYLNLVDWSSSNLLAVGLKNCVYLWNASTSQVSKLCESESEEDKVTSVAWIQRGTHLAVGTTRGAIQIYDVGHQKLVREMGGHKLRVGSLAWNAHILSSGSRDRSILQRDVRAPEDFQHKLIGHKQEVCGLKWSFDGMHLASGGNDNRLLVWDINTTSPLCKFTQHTAAVKAIAWSPHQRGLLTSGGGTADRCLRFWNILNGTQIYSLDTGSQICNLAWSTNVNELVSTHGYSQNQIVIWSYPSLNQIATLTGHTMRVLYLALSPDGQTIVTGAGDETLRFWNVFPSAKATASPGKTSTFSLKNELR